MLFFKSLKFSRMWQIYSEDSLVSLQNPDNYQTCEPFEFSNAMFFNLNKTVEKFMDAIIFGQTVLQNLRHKSLGFSETV